MDFDALMAMAQAANDKTNTATAPVKPPAQVNVVVDFDALIGRHVPLELRDALRIRDRFRCTTPGCTNWARLEMDHTTPHARGGETSYTNLDHLCDTCHKQRTRNDRLFWDSG